MDEHGLKMQQAAAASNVSPHDLAEEVSTRFKSLFDKFSIDYTNFIHTSHDYHKTCVQNFFTKLSSKGFIYQNTYEGWYCVSDETFVTEKQIEEKCLNNGSRILVNKESGHKVEWNSETNYIFKLSHFQDDLIHWLKNENLVTPSRFQEELKHFVISGLSDLSVSRLRNRVSWGVPVPNDQEHTIYVWLDALVNYLTVAGYPDLVKWPPDLQVLGKDILRFHGVYWPALLIAAGLEPPRKLIVHSHWKVDGIKMSKSLGNVLDPIHLLSFSNPDAVRYALLKSGGYDADRSWSNEHFVKSVNTDLANTLGNLLNRCTAPSLNPDQLMPTLDELFLKNSSSNCQTLVNSILTLQDEVENYFLRSEFTLGIESIMKMVRNANLFFDEEKPWELKNESCRNKLNSILYIGLLTVRTAAICLQPIVPHYASQLLDILNISQKERTWNYLHHKDLYSVFKSPSLGARIIPFQRLKLNR